VWYHPARSEKQKARPEKDAEKSRDQLEPQLLDQLKEFFLLIIQASLWPKDSRYYSWRIIQNMVSGFNSFEQALNQIGSFPLSRD